MNKFIVLSLLFLIGTMLMADICAVIKYSTSVRRPYLDDKIVNTRLLWKQTSEGLGPCVGVCARNSSCASVFFNKETRYCHGHSITHGTVASSAAEENNATRYYVQPFGNHYIGDDCSNNVDCETVNSECRDNTCECITGYSFSPRTHECLDDCIDYGYDFTEVPNYFISYSNMQEFEPVSIKDCKELCRNRTEYNCRTLEYGWVSQRCSLQNVTKLDEPTRWYEDSIRQYNISHFQRDCA